MRILSQAYGVNEHWSMLSERKRKEARGERTTDGSLLSVALTRPRLGMEMTSIKDILFKLSRKASKTFRLKLWLANIID